MVVQRPRRTAERERVGRHEHEHDPLRLHGRTPRCTACCATA
jgi:hypothetical protein